MSTTPDELELLGMPARTRSAPERIDLLRQGLSVAAVERLGEALGLPKGRMVRYLGVSLRHLQRHREGRLDPHQSEHLVAMAARVTQGGESAAQSCACGFCPGPGRGSPDVPSRRPLAGDARWQR